MFCVIQEIQRKKPSQYGEYRELEAYSPFIVDGRPKYAYQYTGGRFERPIRTTYKISIHESKRVNGVVTKKQYPVTTVSYYSLAEYWIGDCIRGGKLEAIAVALDTSTDHLWELINAKVDPLEACIKAEFKKTAEYKAHVKHEKTLREYRRLKQAFSKGYSVDPNTYDYCYNVFGEVMNQAYLDEIKAGAKQKERAYSSYYESASGNYDYSKLFSSTVSSYTTVETAMLKKFYRELSKIFHPDKNLETDTHAEMVLLNRLKNEWGV